MQTPLKQLPAHFSKKSSFRAFGTAPSSSLREKMAAVLLQLAAFTSIAATLLILLILLVNSVHFFAQVSPWEFFTGTQFEPFGEPRKLGILPLLAGTFMIAVGSALVAIPLGLGSAVCLTQLVPARISQWLVPAVELLGGVPTVVYGFLALNLVTPMLKQVFPEIEVFNALSASLVVGVAITPMVCSLSVDAIRAVPKSILNAGYALGLQQFHVTTRILIPAAFSGIIASFILAFTRAVGETMAVTLAAGSTPNLHFNYLEGVQTITAFIVQISLGDTPAGTIEYYTIYALGLVLFMITLIFNSLAARLVQKYREVYQ